MEVKTVIDQLGDCIQFNYPPQRIISLVPSQTELLFELTLESEVVGITKFCIHPDSWMKTKKVIGGTKNFWFDIIDQLKPDLIIGNKEENYKEGIIELKKKYPVWMSDVVSLEESLEMINAIGEITARTDQAQSVVDQISTSFNNINKCKNRSVLYLIWKKPWMAAGGESFINNMLETIGLTNCISHIKRYPEITEEQIRLLKPELIFLSSEPYPFKSEHINELQTISPSSKIILVDGEMFSWYGSRLIQAPEYFNTLLKSI